MLGKISEKLKLSQAGDYNGSFSQGEWLIATSLGLLAILFVIVIVSWQGPELAVRSIGGRWFQRVFVNEY